MARCDCRAAVAPPRPGPLVHKPTRGLHCGRHLGYSGALLRRLSRGPIYERVNCRSEYSQVLGLNNLPLLAERSKPPHPTGGKSGLFRVKGGLFAINQQPRAHGYQSAAQVVSRNLRRVRFEHIIEEIKEEIITSLTNDSPRSAGFL
jgi:hypothetical protein